jgi:hypothetical protein
MARDDATGQRYEDKVFRRGNMRKLALETVALLALTPPIAQGTALDGVT